MSHTTKLLVLSLCCSLAGCATKAELGALQSDIDEMKTHTVRLDKEVSGMRGTTREEMEKQSAGLRDELARLKKANAEFQAGLQKEVETFRQGTADLQANLDAAKVDVRALSGRLEEMVAQVKKPGDDVSLLREDLERRLTAVDERLKKLEKGVDDLEKGSAAKKAEAEQTPDALYQRGLKAIKGGEAPQAREQFTKFLELYPDHELAPNVRYWIGESYYTEKNYEQAILEFQQLIKDYPGKAKVPAAMLKQAMAFKELGDQKSSRYVYGKLIDDFPGTAEAKTAKEKLKELK